MTTYWKSRNKNLFSRNVCIATTFCVNVVVYFIINSRVLECKFLSIILYYNNIRYVFPYFSSNLIQQNCSACIDPAVIVTSISPAARGGCCPKPADPTRDGRKWLARFFHYGTGLWTCPRHWFVK